MDLLDRLDRAAAARCSDSEPAHDYLHVRRVAANARALAEAERVDPFVPVAAALLHELFNHPKGHPESHLSGEICAEHAAIVLREERCPEDRIDPIAYAIRVHPFSRGIMPTTIEAAILQDADRLDAIGAIGVARCFATCADMKRPFYSQVDPFCRERAPDDKSFGLDHFAKKLFRIPEHLRTNAAKKLAETRVRTMRAFLDALANEIHDGKG